MQLGGMQQEGVCAMGLQGAPGRTPEGCRQAGATHSVVTCPPRQGEPERGTGLCAPTSRCTQRSPCSVLLPQNVRGCMQVHARAGMCMRVQAQACVSVHVQACTRGRARANGSAGGRALCSAPTPPAVCGAASPWNTRRGEQIPGVPPGLFPGTMVTSSPAQPFPFPSWALKICSVSHAAVAQGDGSVPDRAPILISN